MPIRRRLTISFLASLFLYPFLTDAQNIRGKVIYISTSQEVLLKFRSGITNYNFTPKETASLFEKQLTNKKNFSISSKAENFSTSSLAIMEGENTHLFILQYKDKLDPTTESLYDFSTKEKLRNEVEKMLGGPAETSATPAVHSSTKIVATSQVTKTEESKPISQNAIDLYLDLTLKANQAFLNKNFTEAKDYYKKALGHRPNDPWCVSQIQRIEDQQYNNIVADQRKADELDYQKHIRIADSAFVKMAYDMAKSAYTLAMGEKPNDPYAKAQLSKIDIALKEENYGLYMSIGADALSDQLFNNAESAYEEALKIKPNDAEAKKGLAKAITARTDFLKKQTGEKLKLENENRYNDNEIQRQYNLAVKQGNLALTKADYSVAKNFYAQAQALKPDETLPASQMKLINARLAEIHDADRYQEFIHLGDSSYIVKDYKSALSWYDSARTLQPSATLPNKQIMAVNRELLLLQQTTMKKRRTEEFNNALPYYKKADTLRRYQKYAESYTHFAEFLGKIDTANYDQYARPEQFYINSAKEYLSRLERYKPQPKVDSVAAPIVNDDINKKKKKKKKKDTSLNRPSNQSIIPPSVNLAIRNARLILEYHNVQS